MTTSKIRRFNEVRNEEQRRADSIAPLLAYLIDRHDRIVIPRIQKLAFYAELIRYRDTGECLSDAEWRPYMHGMFSHDAQLALERFKEGNAKTRKTMRDGKVVVAFLDSGVDQIGLPEDTREFLDGVVEETRDVSTKELIAWEKDTRLFSVTDFDTPAEFSRATQKTNKEEAK